MFLLLNVFSRLNEAWERASVYKTNPEAHTVDQPQSLHTPAVRPNTKTQQARRASAEGPACSSRCLEAQAPRRRAPCSRLSVGTMLATGDGRNPLVEFSLGQLVRKRGQSGDEDVHTGTVPGTADPPCSPRESRGQGAGRPAGQSLRQQPSRVHPSSVPFTV